MNNDIKNKIVISIPDIDENFRLVEFFIHYTEEHKNAFNEDVIIGSVYGCYPCIWNGGRPLKPHEIMAKDVTDKISILNQKGITVRYTFTNLFLTEEHCNDVMGNFILKTTSDFQKVNNDINIANDKFRVIMEKRYPNFNYICSTTMCLKDINKINEYTEKYLVVPDYGLNKKIDKLKQLKHPERIELLANEVCVPECVYRKKHYENISLYNLKKYDQFPGCRMNNDSKNYVRGIVNKPHHITLEQMRNVYMPLGINKFKIIGRGSNCFTLIEGLLEYFVKQEYQNEVREDLLNFWFEPEKKD